MGYDIMNGFRHFGDETKAEVISKADINDLVKWSDDPTCNQQMLCAVELQKRRQGAVALQEKLPAFDERTDISADAQYIAGRIVKNLWIIFVLLPVVLGVLFAILTSK